MIEAEILTGCTKSNIFYIPGIPMMTRVKGLSYRIQTLYFSVNFTLRCLSIKHKVKHLN